jgi:Leucine-rich repeat (LRR) protein
MKELLEFLDKHKVDYRVENDKVICVCVYLDNKGISTLPENIGLLDCFRLDLDNNQITELPKSFGDIKCNKLWLHNNDIEKHMIKYLDRIENLERVFTDYSNDLESVKQLCRINSRKDKIKSLLDVDIEV